MPAARTTAARRAAQGTSTGRRWGQPRQDLRRATSGLTEKQERILRAMLTLHAGGVARLHPMAVGLAAGRTRYDASSWFCAGLEPLFLAGLVEREGATYALTAEGRARALELLPAEAESPTPPTPDQRYAAARADMEAEVERLEQEAARLRQTAGAAAVTAQTDDLVDSLREQAAICTGKAQTARQMLACFLRHYGNGATP